MPIIQNYISRHLISVSRCLENYIRRIFFLFFNYREIKLSPKIILPENEKYKINEIDCKIGEKFKEKVREKFYFFANTVKLLK